LRTFIVSDPSTLRPIAKFSLKVLTPNIKIETTKFRRRRRRSTVVVWNEGEERHG